MLTRPLFVNLFTLALGELDAELSERETDFPNGIFEICISALRDLRKILNQGGWKALWTNRLGSCYGMDYNDTYKLKRLLVRDRGLMIAKIRSAIE